MKTEKWYQQGDVIIEPAVAPKNAVNIPAAARGHILEDSVATGHAHVIPSPAHTKVLKDGGVLFIVAARPFTVSHEEHKSITIPKGVYRVRGVQEYDHFEEEARRVID